MPNDNDIKDLDIKEPKGKILDKNNNKKAEELNDTINDSEKTAYLFLKKKEKNIYP